MKTSPFFKAALLLLAWVGCYQASFGQQTLENNLIGFDPIVGYGATIETSRTGGITIGGGANQSNSIIDGDLNNFGSLNTFVGVLGGRAVSVKDTAQYYPGGNRVGFVLGTTGGLLSASLLGSGGFTIRTYRNNVLQETATFGGGGLLQATALGGTGGKSVLSFVTTSDFDEVQLFSNATVAALTSINVYYAFEGPAAAPVDCALSLTGSRASGAPNTGAGGLLCVGSTTGAANVTDTDTTNNATLSTDLGVACSRFLEVTAATTYAGGTEAGFVVNQAGLLNLSVLGNITITTYNGAALQETFSGSSLLSAALISGTNLYRVGFKTGAALPFNRIRITLAGLVGVANNLNVFYAYVITDGDNDGFADCLDKCTGNDGFDTDGDGIPNDCDNNREDLSLTKTSNLDSVAQGGNVTFSVVLKRDSVQYNSQGVFVRDLAPAGTSYVSHVAPTGTFYNPATGIWKVGSALGGATNTLTLQITVKADSVGVALNAAEIIASRSTDIDSPHGNGVTTEDDYATDCFSVPLFICQGQSVTLTGPAGQTTYQWFRRVNGVDVIIPGATSQTLVVTTSGDYLVSATSASGCPTGNCCPVQIRVTPTPVVTFTQSPTGPICAGTPVTLTASAPGATAFLWSTGATTASITVSPLVTTTYTLRVTNAGGCFKDTSVTVTVNPPITSANAIAICNNAGTTSTSADDTFTFVLNPTGGSGTTYSVSGAVTATNVPYGSPQTFGPFLITSGPKVILLTDAAGCTLSVTINPPATCSACPAQPICVPVLITRNP